MAKNGLVRAFDDLPWLIKLLFCIPCLNILWAIYRIVKGATGGGLFMVIVGILWIIPGSVFCWIIDLVCTIIYRKPVVFA